jgi:hypothetical protein
VSRRARVTWGGIYVVLVGALAFGQIHPNWEQQAARSRLSAETRAIRSVFDVEEMAVDGKVLPPADATRWRRLGILRRGIEINWPDGRSERYWAAGEITGATMLELRRLTDAPGVRRGRMDLRHEGDKLVLEGEFEGRRVRARLSKMVVGESLLMTRGFHWINESPFNR